LNVNNVEFVRSAATEADFPTDRLLQIVFLGRSNVGKSSVINKLLNRKNLAYIGSSPGKTAHINFFLIDRRVYFVDVPGYGFAKVAKSEKERWGLLLERYFASGGVSFGVLIVDMRHRPTADDILMADWFFKTGVPFLVVMNKADKLKPSERGPATGLIRQTLHTAEHIKLIPFSAVTGEGRLDLLSEINNLR